MNLKYNNVSFIKAPVQVKKLKIHLVAHLKQSSWKSVTSLESF